VRHIKPLARLELLGLEHVCQNQAENGSFFESGFRASGKHAKRAHSLRPMISRECSAIFYRLDRLSRVNATEWRRNTPRAAPHGAARQSSGPATLCENGPRDRLSRGAMRRSASTSVEGRIGTTRNLRGRKCKIRAKSRKGASTTGTAVADNPRQPLSAARVAARSREEDALSRREALINRSWISCDQSRFWFRVPSNSPFKIGFPHEAPMVVLGCPCLVHLTFQILAKLLNVFTGNMKPRRTGPLIFKKAGPFSQISGIEKADLWAPNLPADILRGPQFPRAEGGS